ncbi:MAG: metalloregulator ArsR/SmtB family transcription factor, partial [Angustibacter sp.]
MGERAAKDALFAEFAAVGKALGHPKRLELLDLLAQGPRSVEVLAQAAGVGVTTCSAQLQTLREAGLVESRREGKRIYYSLSGNDVARLWQQLRQVAQQHRPHTEPARRAYLGPDDTTAVDTAELLRRLASGDVVVVDVRPDVEYVGGHLPGAVNIPLDELEQRLAEPLADTVVALAGNYDTIVAPATASGKNVAPRIAALLDVSQISEIVEVV